MRSHSSQIKWRNRRIGCRNQNEVFTISVDCTDCPIQEPARLDGLPGPDPSYSSHKFGKKAGLRYEIGLALFSNQIVHIKGPLPAGRWQDLKIYTELGLAEKVIQAEEKIIADGIYRHYTVSQKGIGNIEW